MELYALGSLAAAPRTAKSAQKAAPAKPAKASLRKVAVQTQGRAAAQRAVAKAKPKPKPKAKAVARVPMGRSGARPVVMPMAAPVARAPAAASKIEQLLRSRAKVAAKPAPASTSGYRVVRGDTLAKIATRFGIAVTALAQVNGISNANMIRVGQVLKIPARSAGSGAVASPRRPQVRPAINRPRVKPGPRLVSSGGARVVGVEDIDGEAAEQAMPKALPLPTSRGGDASADESVAQQAQESVQATKGEDVSEPISDSKKYWIGGLILLGVGALAMGQNGPRRR